MRKITGILAAAVLVLCLALMWSPPARAELSDGYEYSLLNDGTAVIIGYWGEATDITLPRELDGVPVTMIDRTRESQDRLRYVTSVSVPDSITGIGSYTFYGCNSLTDISLPDSLTVIGNYAFFSCGQLAGVDLPDSVEVIGAAAFANCRQLSAISIPDGVTVIGRMAFYGCEGLRSVSIPESVTSIGEDAFSVCPGVRDYLVSPDNPTYESIGGTLCEKATGTLMWYPLGREDASYTIPDGIERIGRNAFTYDWYGMVKDTPLRSVIIPGCVHHIGPYAFRGCTGLAEMIIPESVTEIGTGAFNFCESLTDIVVPDGITDLSMTFSGCTNLTNVTLPSSLRTLRYGVFSGCRNLLRINIPEGVTEIGAQAFQHSGLSEVTVPGSVQKMEQAFSYCQTLTEVTLGEGITEISARAFEGCDSLRTVNLPSSLRFVGEAAFSRCSSLARMDFTRCPLLLVIDRDAFKHCAGLAEVILPDTLYSLCEGAFGDCAALRAVSWTAVSPANIPVVEGQIQYVPDSDRWAVIRFLARLHARQAGFTVLTDLNSRDEPVNPEDWREAFIDELEEQLSGTEASISDLERQIAEPGTKPGKTHSLENRVKFLREEKLAAEKAIEEYQSRPLLTDSMAAARLEEETGLWNNPSCDTALYQAWQQAYLPMASGLGIPDGFSTFGSYLSSPDGLYYRWDEITTLERIAAAFREDSGGSVVFIPGTGKPGIGAGAFSGCAALESVTLPASLSAISGDAFRGCGNLTVVLEPGSSAEDFCISQGIRYQYAGGDSWLTD